MERSNVLWAKKSREDDMGLWLPLPTHLNDAAEISRHLWNEWVPRSVRRQIANGIHTGNDGGIDRDEVAEKLFVFLAGSHDLGKASPVFQSKSSFFSSETDEQLRHSIKEGGFPLDDGYSGQKMTYHALVSYAILKRNGFDNSVAVVVGGHHGKPPDSSSLRNLLRFQHSCGFDSLPWVDAQELLLDNVLEKAGLEKESAKSIMITRPAQALLSALVIMADWIARCSPHRRG